MDGKAFQDFRVGNVIIYIGKLQAYHNKMAEIVGIEPLTDGTNGYTLLLYDWKKEPQQFFAYPSEVAEIFINENIIGKIGFVKEENINVFRYKTVNMILPYKLIKTNPSSYGPEYKNWAVVVNTISSEPTEEDIEKNTITLPTLHSLQNYLLDVRQLKIDITPLTASINK